MSYEKTDYKTGWSIKVWVENKNTSTYSFYNEFKCHSSNKKLKQEALFISKTNFKHRGNETDELEFYNREFTPDEYKQVWDKWDKDKRDRIEEIKELAKDFNIKIYFRK